MLLERLQGKERVYLDSAAVIYFIERHPTYLSLLRPLFEWVDRGIITGLSSYLTMLEVMVKPLMQGRLDLAEEYRATLIESPNLFLFPMEESVARKGAEIRAGFNIETPDAIQLATAELRGADYFITNDRKLKRFNRVEVLILDDFVQTTS